MTWVLSLCFALMIMYVGFVECTFCLWGDDCYGYLSSKTPYNFIRGDIRDSVNNMQGCEAISVWIIIRHGKRNPGRYFGKKMKEAVSIRELIISSHEEGKGSMCSEDIENLRNCSIDQNIFTGIDYLTDDGYNEMVGIGDRLKDAFQTLLRNIDDDEYTIRAAFGKRMIESAKGFVEGLKNNITKVEESDSNYDLLAPYATCGKYQRDVKNSSNVYTEERRFINATDFLSVKDGIQNRLGLNYSLTTDNVIALYDLCRYTWSGFSNTRSPWCSLFTIDDLKVLEYDGDLRHYYRNGYGIPINKIFGQLPMADLIKRFRESQQGKGKKFTGYITHATMVDMIYTALGLYEDKEPLIGTIIDPNRKWRSTFMSGFGANIISVLYRCNEGNDLKVAFYQNEMPLVSMCSKGICTWEEFETKFSPFLNANIDFCEFKTDLYK